MYAARRTGLKKEMFGYVPGGYARVLEVFHKRLLEEGVHVALGSEVSRISGQSPNEMVVELAGGESAAFDQVVVTLAPPIAAKICPRPQ